MDSLIGWRHLTFVVEDEPAGMESNSGIIQSATPGILQLRNVEDAVTLWIDDKRIVMVLPSIVAYTIIQAVPECPSSLAHVEIYRQA